MYAIRLCHEYASNDLSFRRSIVRPRLVVSSINVQILRSTSAFAALLARELAVEQARAVFDAAGACAFAYYTRIL